MLYWIRMSKIVRQLTSILLSISLLTPLFPANGAEFNPNFILSDEEMQNAGSMTREDIQAFLDKQGGYIATLQTEDAEGARRTVPDIMYRAAMAYTINPKYLLVKLQKEQSLVTDQDPTQKQLDWATGYGVCDSCTTSDPDIQKFRGFGKQVDNAAGIIRWYYDHVSERGLIKRGTPSTRLTADPSSRLISPPPFSTPTRRTFMATKISGISGSSGSIRSTRMAHS